VRSKSTQFRVDGAAILPGEGAQTPEPALAVQKRVLQSLAWITLQCDLPDVDGISVGLRDFHSNARRLRSAEGPAPRYAIANCQPLEELDHRRRSDRFWQYQSRDRFELRPIDGIHDLDHEPAHVAIPKMDGNERTFNYGTRELLGDRVVVRLIYSPSGYERNDARNGIARISQAA
jgi:hypothetical protein